jgi:hypothetical protein
VVANISAIIWLRKLFVKYFFVKVKMGERKLKYMDDGNKIL